MPDDDQHIPRNTLPDRSALKAAIYPWWKGGPTTERIIDVLRRFSSEVTEAVAVGERLSALQVRYNVLTEDMIASEIEKVRAIGLAGPKKTLSEEELRRKMVLAIEDIARRLADARGTTPEFQMAAIVSTFEEHERDSIGSAEWITYWRQMADVARSLPGGRRVMA